MDEAKLKKWEQIMVLLSEVPDPMVHAFFDVDSEELFDEKIEVLTALKAGKHPADIPNYELIMELKPDDDQSHWDI